MTIELGLTPSQTVGPYLGIGLLRDLITARLVDPSDPRAITISGRLLDGEGAPVPDGMVEIWQANAAGRYAHERDARADIPLEEGFLGFGRSGTEDEGRFSFLTVRPGRVPAPTGALQAPHVLVGVFARGLLKRAVTRIYFPDEQEANATDSVLSRLTPQQRQTLVARSIAPRQYEFDIRLQGPGQTTFFAL
jgi:protocatechuate 3,4-dioxygenase alpha subunit